MKGFEFKNPDFHIHSVFSDGTDTPKELLANVKKAGVDIFALTDHDAVQGCAEVKKLLTADDPFFVNGVELTCKDKIGKYHILGYGYDVEKPYIIDAVTLTHSVRLEKTKNRIDYLKEEYGYDFSSDEIKYLLSLKNPGRPHIALMMYEKGLVKSVQEGFEILKNYRGKERTLTPEEAVDAILYADGIPVLAHGILADGSKKLSVSQITERVERLKKCGLMGLECYYSAYTDEQKEIMLDLSERYNLHVTAGSDYHGKNKTVKLGETNSPDIKIMARFYKTLKLLLS